MNIDDPSNAGLSEIVDRLATVRDGSRRVPEFTAISNADFWQIAGIAALEIGNPNVNVTFKGGRVDCTSSPNDEALHQYPDPIMSRTEMLDWFANNEDGFGMDANQVTALMGAHSLGRARTGNSGYNGAWTPGRENTFNNEFYQLLVDATMSFRNRNNLAIEFDALGGILEKDYKYQWTLQDANNNRFTMLNTDIEVAYDIDVDNFGEGTSCEVVVGFMEDNVNTACICPTVPDSNYCSASDTFDLVQTYANDEETFLADFKIAYELMMEKGSFTLSVPV